MSSGPFVLLAIADRALRAQVARRLHDALPCELREALTGPDALNGALQRIPDLAVITTDLPGLDGLAVCHRLRAQEGLGDLPILMLGPRGEQDRKYQAFYVGASDYMELPLDGVEFTYRVRVQLRAWLRRRDTQRSLRRGDIAFDEAQRAVQFEGRSIALTGSEFEILKLLVSEAGCVIGVDRILQDGLRRAVGSSGRQLVHTHIRNLRKKLESSPEQPKRLIRRALGYVWVEAPAESTLTL
ncbi:MAG: response regulator transcription factor [Candidatus Sericytochromatia bacterium]|nr:response regulator transcription factor [Candidatus Sericytochromatia bacterium]